MMIFFYSGARSSELLRVKKSDVYLDKQEYRVIIQKGAQYTETIKIILPNALPFWNEILKEAKANDNLFSKNLNPGPINISPEQITRRWKTHIKDKLVWRNNLIIEKQELKKNDTEYKPITADFYSLKHSFLDRIDKISLSSDNLSSKLASHTTPTITNSIYLVNKKRK